MWIADKIYYQNSSSFTRAYQGSELVWDKNLVPLMFTAKANNSSIGLSEKSTYQSIEYSTNGSTWSNMTTATTISLSSGQSVYVRGILSSNNTTGNYTNFNMAGDIKASGNINYLWNKNNPDAALKQFCGWYLFYGCTALTNVAELELPATTLSDYSYGHMFKGCTSLTSAPELPATTLADGCYIYMFSGCTSLATAPSVLPATTLTRNCYADMFEGCTSLTTAPVLLATTLEYQCCYNMFNGCTSLTSAPALPATTLAYNCYNNMFYGCTSLATAPVLPATTLASRCYEGMFKGCTSLTSAPALPATALTDSCYESMFYGCTSLATAPVLPATTLALDCYLAMFKGCTSLTTVPNILPATALTNSCYFDMFSGCKSLTTAPELPATSLATYCYTQMFAGCTNLNYIKCLATNISESRCTYRWVYGVAATGTFIKDVSMDGWTTGENGIPTNWTVEGGPDFTKKIWWHGTYQFELPTRWNNNYYLEFDYYGTVTANTSNVTIFQQVSTSPIELRLYQRGFYFDMHYPNSTTNATVNSTDYDKRIIKSSGINTAYDGRKCTMRLCCGTTARAKIVDISGTTILDQTTSVTSQSYCTTKDYVFKFVAPDTPVPDWHSSDLRVYDNNGTLIHNFQLYQNPDSNNEYQYYDRITETWYPNINSSGVITDVTTTNR